MQGVVRIGEATLVPCQLAFNTRPHVLGRLGPEVFVGTSQLKGSPIKCSNKIRNQVRFGFTFFLKMRFFELV
jgi:hypothetical protein